MFSTAEIQRRSATEIIVKEDFVRKREGLLSWRQAIVRKENQEGHEQNFRVRVSHVCFSNRKGRAWLAH